MIRAIMEGVSYSLLDCLEIIREMNIPVTEVRASGGGGRSPLWRQIQSDMFHTDIHTINSSEGPALGVAILAGVGTGVYDSVAEACQEVIKRKTTQKPNEDNGAVYDRYYPVYKQLYHALKPSFDAVARVAQQSI